MNEQRQIAVKICLGSACYTRGNRETLETLKAYLAEQGLAGTVQLTGSLCEEVCRKGPVVMIEGTQYTGVDAEGVIALLDTHLKRDAA